jgi:hypothetical protein
MQVFRNLRVLPTAPAKTRSTPGSLRFFRKSHNRLRRQYRRGPSASGRYPPQIASAPLHPGSLPPAYALLPCAWYLSPCLTTHLGVLTRCPFLRCQPNRLERVGFNIDAEDYAVDHEGNRLFGLLEVETATGVQGAGVGQVFDVQPRWRRQECTRAMAECCLRGMVVWWSEYV